MRALLTEEQQMLGGVVSELAHSIGIANPADLESVDRDRGWSEIAQVGLLGLRLRDGGQPGATGVEVMIMAEKLAERLAPQPYLGGAILPGELLALAEAPAPVQGRVADGASRGCVLLRSDLAALAAPPFDGAVAWDCAGADFALGVDVAEGALSLHPVTSFDPVEAADLTRTVAEVVVGPAQETWHLAEEALERWHALALVGLSADTVGAMRGALAGVVAYTKERFQFGVPIGSFQAVQHICADALVMVEGTASTVKYAAWAVDELPSGEALLAARVAKAYSAGVAQEVGEAVMQVYGGMGQTWDNIAHFYLRRQMLSTHVLGDEGAQLEMIARARLGS